MADFQSCWATAVFFVAVAVVGVLGALAEADPGFLDLFQHFSLDGRKTSKVY